LSLERSGLCGEGGKAFFLMEFNRCLGAEDEERRQEGGRDDIDSIGNEELDLVQMYLTFLPERYVKAKFTLAVYLMCWLLLELCKVRDFSANM